MNKNGVILKRLRETHGLTLRAAAKKIGRSTGWLSEVENAQGKAVLKEKEFQRILALYDGEKHKSKFGIWVKCQLKEERTGGVSFDGAIFKYLRLKSQKSLLTAAKGLGLSIGHLSNIESGRKIVGQEMREKLMNFYGYSIQSFRNFKTADKRAKNIPDRFKLDILLSQFDETQVSQLFQFGLELTQNGGNENA